MTRIAPSDEVLLYGVQCGVDQVASGHRACEPAQFGGKVLLIACILASTARETVRLFSPNEHDCRAHHRFGCRPRSLPRCVALSRARPWRHL